MFQVAEKVFLRGMGIGKNATMQRYNIDIDTNEQSEGERQLVITSRRPDNNRRQNAQLMTRSRFQRRAATFLLLLLACARRASGAATARAEHKLYEPEGTTTTTTTATFADYHALLDWYYAETAAGRKPDGQTLRAEIRRTMNHRLSQPQKYYEGTGYVPGEDEGWRPDGVDWETYKLYREERNEAVHREQLEADGQ